MKKFTLFFVAIGLSLGLTPLAQASFSDVPASHPNYDAINYVQAKGIVQGYPDGTYQPAKTIDRYEFTKIIVAAVNSKEDIAACKTSPFKDVPADQWFTPYVCLAQKTGVVGGYPDGTFQGTNKIKLVEAAKIIVNGYKYPITSDPIWYKPYLLKLEELKALPVSLNGFEHQVTRGEMAEMIDRLMEKITTRPSTTYANLEAGVLIQDNPNTNTGGVALNEIYNCDKVKTVNFVVDEKNMVEYGAFTWKGKIISTEENGETYARLEVETGNGTAYNFYKDEALKRNNQGPNRYLDGKLYFALGSLENGKLVTSAEQLDAATKTLIEQKVNSGETVTLDFAVKFIEGGGAGNYGVTNACYINQYTSSLMANNQPIALNHIYYTSSYHTATQYYCDTDPSWKNLSPQYLQSYPSEAELLKVYPYKTLNQPC